MELPACPVETTLMLIGDKWKVLILRDLMDGTKRFGELKKSIGHVTQKVLTAQLRDMEAKGLLTDIGTEELGHLEIICAMVMASKSGLPPAAISSAALRMMVSASCARSATIGQ